MRPVGIELTAKIFVGVESGVFAENHFQESKKGGFACVSLVGNQQQDRQHLCGAGIEDLQPVETQLDLFAEDMIEKVFDTEKLALYGYVA